MIKIRKRYFAERLSETLVIAIHSHLRCFSLPFCQVKSFDCSIPSSTSILLPRVDVSGALEDVSTDALPLKKNDVRGLHGKRHFKIVADIGTFNQNLSTDLLNHLIFIQKGFMKVLVFKKSQ